MNDLIEKLNHLAWLKKRARLSSKVAERRKDEAKQYELDLFQIMEDLGLKSLNTHTHTFVPRTTVRSYITDMDAFEAWLEDEGVRDDFLRVEEQKARLNELVRERLDRKEDLPPGVGWYPQQVISTTER